jgi:hypothetical protein
MSDPLGRAALEMSTTHPDPFGVTLSPNPFIECLPLAVMAATSSIYQNDIIRIVHRARQGRLLNFPAPGGSAVPAGTSMMGRHLGWRVKRSEPAKDCTADQVS